MRFVPGVDSSSSVYKVSSFFLNLSGKWSLCCDVLMQRHFHVSPKHSTKAPHPPKLVAADMQGTAIGSNSEFSVLPKDTSGMWTVGDRI